MRISNTILSVLNDIKEEGRLGSVIYANPSTANVRASLNTAKDPIAFYFVTTDGSFNTADNTMKETATIRMAFVKRVKTTSVDGSATDTLLDSLTPIISEFVARLREYGWLDVDGDIPFSVLYNMDDTNTCGFNLVFKARTKNGECISIPVSDEDNEEDNDQASTLGA